MRFLSNKLSYYWQQTKYFCVHSVLHADDPPHKLAMGIAVGIFVAFLPLIGIQMALSVALAWVVGGNKAVGVPLVWISNPFTMVPIYYPGYWLGCKILNMPLGGKWAELLESGGSWTEKISQFASSLADVAGPLLLGTFIIALPIGIVSYYASLFAIKSYRMKRWGQLMPPNLTPPAKRTGDEDELDNEHCDAA